MLKLPKSRFYYMIPVGFAIAGIIRIFSPVFRQDHPFLIDAGISSLLSFLIWEGNYRLNCWFNNHVKWENGPLKRAMLQGLVNVIFTISLIFFILSLYDQIVCRYYHSENTNMIWFAMVMGTLVSLILQSLTIGAEFFTQWKASLLEVERYKKEALNTQLQMLKSQINPHFLFNNLSVLNSLIEQDPVKASEFTSQFAKVYRHLLNNRDNEMITLEEESKLLESYCYLLGIRFGRGISIQKHIEPSCMGMFLPPLSLQILVENCIQHNIITESQPLHISIFASGNNVNITNNLIPKVNGIHGSGLGHHNISLRLKHYTERKLSVTMNENKYTVEIPLLQSL